MELFKVNENKDLEKDITKHIPPDKMIFNGYMCENCDERYEMCKCEGTDKRVIRAFKFGK